ncbi:MAG: hypothetical protein ABI158_04595 [Edaphobacter sp.]
MKYVEHIESHFEWAQPLQGKELNVEIVGSDLQITGLFPVYSAQGSACDLIRQYEQSPRKVAIGHQTGTQSPEISFANADTNEKLIAFVRRFGPVVAASVQDTRLIPDKELGEPLLPCHLIAYQDMQELRNEQVIYRSALALVMQMAQPEFDFDSVEQLIKIIAANIQDWPRQRKREKLQRQVEPEWKASSKSLERINSLSSRPPDPISGRIVICELLNSFPSIVFPSPLEMHSSIKFGLRSLLYSLLRRQFIYPRTFAICVNTECRKFFNTERAGQQFCSPECSLHHRQRVYWQERGKRLRKKRTAQHRKTRK